jgi:hypothetical protein
MLRTHGHKLAIAAAVIVAVSTAGCGGSSEVQTRTSWPQRPCRCPRPLTSRQSWRLRSLTQSLCRHLLPMTPVHIEESATRRPSEASFLSTNGSFHGSDSSGLRGTIWEPPTPDRKSSALMSSTDAARFGGWLGRRSRTRLLSRLASTRPEAPSLTDLKRRSSMSSFSRPPLRQARQSFARHS